MYSWGIGKNGQLGVKDPKDFASTPQKVELPENVIISQVACSHKFNLAVSTEGDLYSWGSGPMGELGQGYLSEQSTPKKITKLPSNDLKFKQVAVGQEHSLALSVTGDIYVWGSNDLGQLGLGHFKPFDRPQRLMFEGEFISIHAQSKISMGLTDKNELYIWGAGWSGQNTSQECISIIKPTLVGNDFSVKYMSCGEHSCLVVTTRHKFHSWGSGGHGRLGHGSTTDFLEPKLIESISNISLVPKKVVAGYDHTAILTDKGQVYIWGSGPHGELGIGQVSRQKVPILLDFSVENPVSDLSIGNQFTAAVTTTNEVYTWGSSSNGRLGNGIDDKTIIDSPTKVNVPEPVSKVYCGRDHVIVLVKQ